jgi:hypothetical protein
LHPSPHLPPSTNWFVQRTQNFVIQVPTDAKKGVVQKEYRQKEPTANLSKNKKCKSRKIL